MKDYKCVIFLLQCMCFSGLIAFDRPIDPVIFQMMENSLKINKQRSGSCKMNNCETGVCKQQIFNKGGTLVPKCLNSKYTKDQLWDVLCKKVESSVKKGPESLIAMLKEKSQEYIKTNKRSKFSYTNLYVLLINSPYNYISCFLKLFNGRQDDLYKLLKNDRSGLGSDKVGFGLMRRLATGFKGSFLLSFVGELKSFQVAALFCEKNKDGVDNLAALVCSKRASISLLREVLRVLCKDVPLAWNDNNAPSWFMGAYNSLLRARRVFVSDGNFIKKVYLEKAFSVFSKRLIRAKKANSAS